MSKLSFFRRRQGSRESGGGAERTESVNPLQKAAEEDPFASIIGALIGERGRLPTRDKLMEGLNLLTATKGLDAAERGTIANKILQERAKKEKESTG